MESTSSRQLAYSISDAIRVSGIGRTALFAEIKSGKISARKRGRRTLILAADLDAFLKNLPEAGRRKANQSVGY